VGVPQEIFKVDRQSKLPLYDQIERNLRSLIIDGSLKPGETMPSEWDLSDIYGVSRMTVRHALDELVRQNWLSKRQGVGTFVAKPTVASIAPSKLSFTQQMLAIGRQPSSRLIHNQVTEASPEISRYLQLKEGDPIVELTRVRLADNIPILLETSNLSDQNFPGLLSIPGLVEGSLYHCLSIHFGVDVTHIDQTLKPVLLTEEQAQPLGAQAGSPSIQSESLVYSSQGKIVEYSWSVANGENSEFNFSFRRDVPVDRSSLP
jgi:GntR family transcriptional regulator